MKPLPEERLIVALDVPDLKEASRLLETLSPTVRWFKIGHQLFTAAGPQAVSLVKKSGARVFLDLKYHDIPNTVSGAVEAAVALGADMINLHASGGAAMMAAAAKAAAKHTNRPILLAVTALTSLDSRGLEQITGIGGLSVEEHVLRLAALARDSGVDGVVASPLEIRPLRERFGEDFVILTPGIRPPESAPEDQSRTATPAQAVSLGADFIVVGRPITRAPDPLQSARSIIKEMSHASAG
jgi:orotidine-5'-phosphate decarboxylase